MQSRQSDASQKLPSLYLELVSQKHPRENYTGTSITENMTKLCWRASDQFKSKLVRKFPRGNRAWPSFSKTSFFGLFGPRKAQKRRCLRKFPRGNRALPSFSKTSFLDFLAREKLKNDVSEKISSDDLVPMYSFVQKLSPVMSQHGLELATLKSDVVEKPSDFNLMTCLFRGV